MFITWLAYAFQVLRQNSYEDVVAEEFEEISDLFAEDFVSAEFPVS